jgi:hypothetical protein
MNPKGPPRYHYLMEKPVAESATTVRQAEGDALTARRDVGRDRRSIPAPKVADDLQRSQRLQQARLWFFIVLMFAVLMVGYLGLRLVTDQLPQ